MTLYFLSRVPLFTPLTTNALDAEKNYKLLDEAQLHEAISGVTLDKTKNLAALKRADQNHMIYWDEHYVHALAEDRKFLDLDSDFSGALKKIMTFNTDMRAQVLHLFLFDYCKGELDAGFVKDLVSPQYFEKLEELKAEHQEIEALYDTDKDAWDQRYQNFIDKTVDIDLARDSSFDDDISKLVHDFYTKGGDRSLDMLRRLALDYVTANSECDGIILGGNGHMHAGDAIRGARYVGTAPDVFTRLESGCRLLPSTLPQEPVLKEVVRGRLCGLTPNDQNLKELPAGMISDYLSGCPFPKMRPLRGEELPELMDKGRRAAKSYDEEWPWPSAEEPRPQPRAPHPGSRPFAPG